MCFGILVCYPSGQIKITLIKSVFSIALPSREDQIIGPVARLATSENVVNIGFCAIGNGLSNNQLSFMGDFMVQQPGITLQQTSSGSVRFELSSTIHTSPDIHRMISHWNTVNEVLSNDRYDEVILQWLRSISILRAQTADSSSYQWLYQRSTIGAKFAAKFLEACSCHQCRILAGVVIRAPWLTFTGRQSTHIFNPLGKNTNVLYCLPLIWISSILLFDELLSDELESLALDEGDEV